MKVLMVLTSHDQLGNTGRKTGFWLEELAAPYYAFKDAGAEIVLASPQGGQPPLDPKSNEPANQTDLTRRFETDEAARRSLRPRFASTVFRRRSSTPSSIPAVTGHCGISRRTGIPSN
jgi:putative intracellular protease/amidase